LAPAAIGRVEVAHVDHGLRADGAADARFCRELAEDLGLPYHLLRLRAEALRAGEGTQAEARRLRRRFFQEVRRDRGLDAIALGHHADDQVETVLFRVLRGAGPRGLAGMAEWAPPYFRPFLGVRRAELEALARREQWPHREDPTNRTARYARNRLRNEALPLLRAIHPGVDEAVLRLAGLLREEDELLSGEAAAILARLGTAEPEGLRLEAVELRRVPGAIRRRVYLAAWEALGLDPVDLESRHLEAVDQLTEPGRAHRRAPVPGPGAVAASYGQLWFLRPGVLGRRRVAVRLGAPGRAVVPVVGVTACWGAEPPSGGVVVPVPGPHREAGLILRTWEPGDRVPVRPGRVRKVKDLLMDARVPAWRRDRALIVLHGASPCGLFADGKAWGAAESPGSWVWLADAPDLRAAELPENPAEKRCCASDRCDT
jgi:tRNA(Ile)-lysidine synthase